MRSDSCSSLARSQQRSSALHPCRTGASRTQIDARRAGWKAIQGARSKEPRADQAHTPLLKLACCLGALIGVATFVAASRTSM
jgi:hypothetical protein